MTYVEAIARVAEQRRITEDARAALDAANTRFVDEFTKLGELEDDLQRLVNSDIAGCSVEVASS